jgi:hypothetical protein
MSLGLFAWFHSFEFGPEKNPEEPWAAGCTPPSRPDSQELNPFDSR